MSITPYRKQLGLLTELTKELREARLIDRLDVEAYTLDSCQGREAEYVFVSLVRGKASTFMDAPKRWNVALTRAKKGLCIVGDIDSYLTEAREAHGCRRGMRTTNASWNGGGPQRSKMSLLARILEEYDLQIGASRRARLPA